MRYIFFITFFFLVSCSPQMYETSRERTEVFATSDGNVAVGYLEKGSIIRLNTEEATNGRVKLWSIERWIERDSIKKNNEEFQIYYIAELNLLSDWPEADYLFNPYVTIQFYGKNKVIMQEPLDREASQVNYERLYVQPRKFRNSFGTYTENKDGLVVKLTSENIVTENQVYCLPYAQEVQAIERTLECSWKINTKKKEPAFCKLDVGRTMYAFPSEYRIMGYEGRNWEPLREPLGTAKPRDGD